jgi:predicted acylesterase/phospholipase RssA
MPVVAERIELERLAVLTLQGGGVYGLTLAGQLDSVINDFGLRPVAVAGTSAGTIVAALYWAGHTPGNIRAIFEELATGGQIPQLLGPFDPPEHPFTFQRLARLRRDVAAAWGDLQSQSDVPVFERPFFRLLGPLAMHAWSLWSEHGDIFQNVAHRGIFRGDTLADTIERLIMQGPVVQAYRADLREIMGDDPHLRFGHVRGLEERHNEILFPALFITATNMRTRRIEVFNSVDQRYATTPIAVAARASGGFPIFFRPVQVPTADSSDWYVDGGVISNFPVWVFSQKLRERMGKDKRFKAIAQRPWMHVGLRRGADALAADADLADPLQFGSSLGALLTGGARDNLEDLLSASVSPSRTVAQPVETTGGPKDVLDVASLSPAKVGEMFSKGAAFAEGKLHPLTFDIGDSAKQEIDQELGSLLVRCEAVLGGASASEGNFRTNLYLPWEEKLYRRFWHRMAPPTSHGFELDQGLTGFCFTHRVPVILNLEGLRCAALADDLGDDNFGMTKEDHLKVDATRTWLFSIPIFDPNDFVVPAIDDRADIPQAGRFHFVLPRVLDGVIYGVLNVDAGFDYRAFGIDTNPAIGFTDTRISAIIDLTRVAAARIGRRLAVCFGGKERSHE